MEAASQHDQKAVEWDVKQIIKQTAELLHISLPCIQKSQSVGFHFNTNNVFQIIAVKS